MKWEDILKRTLTHEQRFLELCLGEGLYLPDAIEYNDEFPMGRPMEHSPKHHYYRFFYQQDEMDWEANENKEGRQKNADNPYIAPNWKPDRYADVVFIAHKPYIHYHRGDKDFYKMLEGFMEQAVREVEG